MAKSPESFPSGEQEPTKDEEKVDMEEVRKREAIRMGLSEKASFSEIVAAIDEQNRKRAAAELGLSDTADWIEIHVARNKAAGGKKYHKREKE